jgi:hypothetical protein
VLVMVLVGVRVLVTVQVVHFGGVYILTPQYNTYRSPEYRTICVVPVDRPLPVPVPVGRSPSKKFDTLETL